MSAPRKGDEIVYRGARVGVVASVDGNLCWVDYYDGRGTQPFIWQFPRERTLNTLHDWPGKTDVAP